MKKSHARRGWRIVMRVRAARVEGVMFEVAVMIVLALDTLYMFELM